MQPGKARLGEPALRPTPLIRPNLFHASPSDGEVWSSSSESEEGEAGRSFSTGGAWLITARRAAAPAAARTAAARAAAALDAAARTGRERGLVASP